MGSEHYCLRWNNHQSNLLGVFSQLLQDESLVDVTLACSEGASIRAHKVVLSACSSYFQSLFLDHPSRHPIVILKDVRFSELQTLVEFMYKGEVNVQYCQLSALLKTAESLKVKGLAEMTNQSTALREPEREPDRLRPHSQPKPSTAACDTSLETAGGVSSQSIITQTTSSTTVPSPSSSSSTPGIKHERERGSPSPPPSLKRLHQPSPGPLDLYQKRCPSRSNRELETITVRTPTNIISDDQPSPNDRLNSTDEDENMSNDVGLNMTLSGSNQSGLGAIQIHGSSSGCLSGSDSICNISASVSGSQQQQHQQQQQQHQQILSATQSVVVPPMNSSGNPCPIQTTSTDLTRPLSRSSGSGTGGGGGSGNLGNNGGSNNATGSSGCIASSSRISSPILSTEPVAGPSGLGPVQSVPLYFRTLQSLKKEVDWERTDEKPSIESMEYHRHSHDSVEEHILPTFARSLTAHHVLGRCRTPFGLPFNPFGLNLFDTDPSRILSILHHQTLLAEEALRYRGLLFSPKDPVRFNSINDILTKERVNLYNQVHRFSSLGSNCSSNNNNNNNNSTNSTSSNSSTNNSTKSYSDPKIPSFSTSGLTLGTNGRGGRDDILRRSTASTSACSTITAAGTTSVAATAVTTITPTVGSNSPSFYESSSNILEELRRRSEETVQKEEEELELNENGCLSSRETLNEFLRRRSTSSSSSSFILDGFRTNIPRPSSSSGSVLGGSLVSPTAMGISSTETLSNREKSSSSSTSSNASPPPSSLAQQQNPPFIKPVSDAVLFSEPIEEETKCVVCNANFPNVWLLEQHAALQHANLGPNEEKPFICEQCGQSYRYRSAYAKHKEQNHRARLPADKLFTCDVCGMQFRYLKSFKKHRLNHALERLHGKKDLNRKSTEGNTSNLNNGGGHQSQDIVTSSNETLPDENTSTDLRINIKREKDEEDQDNTVDSAGGIFSVEAGEQNITSSEGIHSTNKRPRLMSPMEPEPSHTTTSINSLINAERIPSDQVLGLNPQEASILNFLRVDAAERQRDKRPPASRFACPFCGKCVRSKENLKLHVRKHTGERPFVCLFCGRAFGGKSDLTRHLRIHTGERPYHCESCGKCFARADYLSKHLTTHIHNAPR